MLDLGELHFFRKKSSSLEKKMQTSEQKESTVVKVP